MNNSLPIVAIVGPPNAGKSTLLNKINGGQLAVTSEVAGTTRDRQYITTHWDGRDFIMVDTAGLDMDAKGELEENIQKQINRAVKEADVIVMVVDGKAPVGALDRKVLTAFRKLKTTKILAINKVDSPRNLEKSLGDFARLGIKDMFPISALTGRGIGDMLDSVVQALLSSEALTKEDGLPEKDDTEDASATNYQLPTTNSPIAVSILGKPNVGKSSLFNKILDDERSVVSAVPGTTRTAIDDNISINGINYTFIDTAGLKKKEHKQSKPDIFSTFQTFRSIRRSDVCLFVLDANEEITVQDQRIAREILNMQKGCIIIMNKIDKFSESQKKKELEVRAARKGKNQADDNYQSLQDYVSHHFPFLWMCPVFFVSAQNGEGIQDAIKAIKPIYDRRHKTLNNEVMAEFLNKKMKANPPKLLRDQKKPKIFSLTQIEINPPTFSLLVNHPAAISLQFRKYLENSIIKELDFWGTPIKLHLKKKLGPGI
jgi:GTP-binding protein